MTYLDKPHRKQFSQISNISHTTCRPKHCLHIQPRKIEGDNSYKANLIQHVNIDTTIAWKTELVFNQNKC